LEGFLNVDMKSMRKENKKKSVQKTGTTTGITGTSYAPQAHHRNIMQDL
jgi:hypothetical protein